MVASGSMGDVRPYAVLAGAFAAAGWDAGLVANAGYEGLAARFRVAWFAAALPRLDQVQAWQRRQNAQQVGLFDAALWDTWFGCYPAAMAALTGADVVVSRIPWVADMARVLGVPFVLASNTPAVGLRADLPHVGVGRSIGAMAARRRALSWVPGGVAALNLVSHAGAIFDRVGLLWRERRSLGALRGLPGRHVASLTVLAPQGEAGARALLAKRAGPDLSLVGLSASVLPPRAGERFTGLWRGADTAVAPPPALARVLEGETPTIYVGFGSVPCMPDGRDFSELSRLVVEAVRLAGVRAVLARGWGGLDAPRDDPDLVVVDDVPHDWLFPRVRAVVHHCGVGTSVAALAAGRPSVPVPFLQDEPFWAWRLHDLGVAPVPLDPQRLRADALAAAMRMAVEDGPMIARAAALGATLRAEDGLRTAVDLVGGLLDGRPGMERRQ